MFETTAGPNWRFTTLTATVPSIDLVYVDGGTFVMGNSNSFYSDEQPAHSVSLSSFYMSRMEVTQAQWRELVLWKQTHGGTSLTPSPSNYVGDNLPVDQVSWGEAQLWLTYLNEREGTSKYRLPTEAEWEFASRGGTKSGGFVYSGSNSVAEVAWYGSNSGSQPHQVGGKASNELGIYDMSGNVWEWCQDSYGAYLSTSRTNPTGPSTGTNRFTFTIGIQKKDSAGKSCGLQLVSSTRRAVFSKTS